MPNTMTWKGAWVGDGSNLSVFAYIKDDAVKYNGIVYVSTSNNIPIGSPSPDSDMSNWDVVVIDGTSGISGTSGESGSSGTSGISGINGTSGSSGTSGTSGTSGESGSSGTSGESGSSGTSGTSFDVYRTTSINTSTHSATFSYEYYGVVYTGGICTITLPLGSSPVDEGKFITIADESGGVSWENRGILVQGTSGQLINGENSVLMKIERISLTFLFRNNSWKTI